MPQNSLGISSNVPWEKTGFLFLSRQHLQVASGLGWDFCVHLLFAVLGSCPVWACAILCMLSQSLRAHMCINPIVSGRHCLLEVTHHLWLLQSVHLHLCIALRTSRSVDKQIPFRAECPKVSHCLHTVLLCVSVNWHLLQEKVSLMVVEQCTDMSACF